MTIKQRASWTIVPLGLVAAISLLIFLPEDMGDQAQALPPSMPSVHMGIPPSELVHSGPDPKWSTTVASGHEIQAKVEVHMHFKAIVILWSYRDSTNYKTASARQVITLPYWPTDAISTSDVELVVAGKMRRGETAIETIEIANPTLVFDITTGDPTLTPAALGDREYVYFESTVGRDMVTWLRSMKQDMSELLVRFYDSGDVYKLDLATETLTLQASASAGMGVPHVPELSGAWSGVWEGNHTTLGYVYVLNEYGSLDSVVLIDSDRDGDVDTHIVADETVWTANGMGVADNYTDWN